MASRSYPSDLTDNEWDLLKPHLPAPRKRGRPGLHTTREILDAVFYVLKTGCQWRMLPREFPPWKTVCHYFRRWRIYGIWERMNRVLRRRLRGKLGREPEPSAGIVDAQSVKTTGVGGEQRGFDGGKKVRGRKRHILVDTEGLVVEAKVHSAKVPDQDGIRRLLEPARDRLPRLSFLWADAGYRGRGKEVGGRDLGRGGRDSEPLPEAAAGEGLADLGQGMGFQGRAPGGPGQAAEASGLREPAAPVGGGNAPSRGSRTTEGWPGTTSGCARRAKPSSTRRWPG